FHISVRIRAESGEPEQAGAVLWYCPFLCYPAIVVSDDRKPAIGAEPRLSGRVALGGDLLPEYARKRDRVRQCKPRVSHGSAGGSAGRAIENRCRFRRFRAGTGKRDHRKYRSTGNEDRSPSLRAIHDKPP